MLGRLGLQNQLRFATELVHPVCVVREQIVLIIVNESIVTDNRAKVFDVVLVQLKYTDNELLGYVGTEDGMPS